MLDYKTPTPIRAGVHKASALEKKKKDVDASMENLAPEKVLQSYIDKRVSEGLAKKDDADGNANAKADADAAEARDMASDLNTVMADFAHNGAGEIDEDELMAELEGMMAEDAEPPPPADAQATERARLAEIADLEAKLAARKADREHNEAVRAAVESMPSAPTGRAARREEKAGLLAASVGA